MTEAMLAVAADCCNERIVITQEGGYAREYAPYCSAAIGQTLVGLADGGVLIPDPYGERAITQPASVTLGLDAEAAIERAVKRQERHWAL
jgi:hypothetical protein